MAHKDGRFSVMFPRSVAAKLEEVQRQFAEQDGLVLSLSQVAAYLVNLGYAQRSGQVPSQLPSAREQ